MAKLDAAGFATPGGRVAVKFARLLALSTCKVLGSSYMGRLEIELQYNAEDDGFSKKYGYP